MQKEIYDNNLVVVSIFWIRNERERDRIQIGKKKRERGQHWSRIFKQASFIDCMRGLDVPSPHLSKQLSQADLCSKKSDYIFKMKSNNAHGLDIFLRILVQARHKKNISCVKIEDSHALLALHSVKR